MWAAQQGLKARWVRAALPRALPRVPAARTSRKSVPIRLERGLEEFRSPCQSSPMDSGGVNLHKQELNAEL